MFLAILSFLQVCDLNDIDVTVPSLPMTALYCRFTGHCVWSRCLDISIFPWHSQLSLAYGHHWVSLPMDWAVYLVLLVIELSGYLRNTTAEQNGFLLGACSQVFLVPRIFTTYSCNLPSLYEITVLYLLCLLQSPPSPMNIQLVTLLLLRKLRKHHMGVLTFGSSVSTGTQVYVGKACSPVGCYRKMVESSRGQA